MAKKKEVPEEEPRPKTAPYEVSKDYRIYECFRCGNLSGLVAVRQEYGYGLSQIDRTPIAKGWTYKDKKAFCAFCTKFI